MYPGTCALPFTCLMGPYGRLQSHSLSVTTPQGRLRPVRPDSDLSPRRRHDAVGNHSGAVPRRTRRIDGVGVGGSRRPTPSERCSTPRRGLVPRRGTYTAPRGGSRRPGPTALRRRSQDLTSSSAKTPPSRQKRLTSHSRRRVASTGSNAASSSDALAAFAMCQQPWKNRAGSLSSSNPLTKQTTAQHEATKASLNGRVLKRAPWPFGARLFHLCVNQPVNRVHVLTASSGERPPGGRRRGHD